MAAIAWFYEEITDAETSQDRLEIPEFDDVMISPFALTAELEADEQENEGEPQRRDSTDSVNNQPWDTILESVSIFFSNFLGGFWMWYNGKRKKKRAPVTFSLTNIPPTQKKSRKRNAPESPEASTSQKQPKYESPPKTDDDPNDITLA